MIEAVLFDLDGTLLDHAGAAAAALADVQPDADLPVPRITTLAGLRALL
ncbi:hypothetical protein ACQEU3_07925 [Spirillospora sp. CA-253888]